MESSEYTVRDPEETVSYEWALEAFAEILDRSNAHSNKIDTFDASWYLSIIFPFREKEETMDDLLEARATLLKNKKAKRDLERRGIEVL